MEDLTKFTVENARHIVDMLTSSDNESIELGLRTLPGMDYVNYPHIYKFIIDETFDHWWMLKDMCEHKDMCKVITIAHTIGWYHQGEQLLDLNPCEIEIARALIEDHVNREANRFLADTKFKATVTIDYYES